MKKLNRLPVFAFFVLFLTPLATAQIYTVTDLGTLPGGPAAGFPGSYGLSVNAFGQVVGQAFNSGGESRAFLWATGRMQDLGTLPGSTDAEAYTINNLGQAVGFSGSFMLGTRSAVLWTRREGIQDLGMLPGDAESAAFGINDLGMVVGDSSGHAFLWTKREGMQNLGMLPGAIYATAWAINDLGQVVGDSGGFSFLWTKNEGMQDLGAGPGGITSSARAINNLGQVVGYLAGPSTLYDAHAFLWTKATGMQDLGTLPGIGLSTSLGINDLGQVVGNSGNFAFLWTKNEGMQNLNDLIPADSGWVLQTANSINLWGQITGLGTINGQTHAFLLTYTRKRP